MNNNAIVGVSVRVTKNETIIDDFSIVFPLLEVLTEQMSLIIACGGCIEFSRITNTALPKITI